MRTEALSTSAKGFGLVYWIIRFSVDGGPCGCVSLAMAFLCIEVFGYCRFHFLQVGGRKGWHQSVDFLYGFVPPPQAFKQFDGIVVKTLADNPCRIATRNRNFSVSGYISPS